MVKVTTSLIVTVFNEEKTIGRFLDSILSQTTHPSEVIIVDGGSGDQTISNIKSQMQNFQNKGITLVAGIMEGNRSVGRNEAIRRATHELILISDAGCELDEKWVEEIVKPFSDRTVDVVAGYYKGIFRTAFEKCLIPYVLVMEDRVNPDTFLPATRSMAMKKSVWEKAGKFPENYSHNEDYVFANRLKKMKAKIVFQKSAIVRWYPRSTFRQAFIMFWRFAYGDSEAGIFRKKVLLLFTRYLLASIILIYIISTQNFFLSIMYLVSCIMYLVWSIFKNYRYVNMWQAIYLLPLLQITADLAVLLGTLGGTIKQWATQHKQ